MDWIDWIDWMWVWHKNGCQALTSFCFSSIFLREFHDFHDGFMMKLAVQRLSMCRGTGFLGESAERQNGEAQLIHPGFRGEFLLHIIQHHWKQQATTKCQRRVSRFTKHEFLHDIYIIYVYIYRCFKMNQSLMISPCIHHIRTPKFWRSERQMIGALKIPVGRHLACGQGCGCRLSYPHSCVVKF